MEDEEITKLTIKQLRILKDKYVLAHKMETNIDIKKGIRSKIRELDNIICVLEKGD